MSPAERNPYGQMYFIESSSVFSVKHFRPFFPMVWGKQAKDNYEELHQLGQFLYTKLSANQVSVSTLHFFRNYIKFMNCQFFRLSGSGLLKSKIDVEYIVEIRTNNQHQNI